MQANGNIFLVGLMGAGKTSIGRALARIANKQFYDSDHELERRTGVNIPTIFEIEGEAKFRLREEEMIKMLIAQHNIVLATGGGVILSPNNRQALTANGTVVYLHANLDQLWARTCYDKNRPLLQTDQPKKQLETLYTARDPLYREAADLIIETAGKQVQMIAHTLWQQLTADDQDN